MNFINLTFPIFLAVVFILYWCITAKNLRLQNALLLFSSYVFYGWWDWRFLFLIILTSSTTYFTAIGMQCTRFARQLLWGNIILNVAVLFIFKYLNFFGENLANVFSLLGWNLDWFTLDILLPVGISFYTFQAIGYSVDVYYKRISPSHDIIAFYTFIAYFPQLVAGPIERASQLLPQIERRRKWSYPEAVSGMRLILLGVLKKVCISNSLSIYADRIFDVTQPNALQVVSGTILFSFVIYFDFSAYSEIAKGVSSLLGINLMKNFNLPYFSRNVVEFWSRWHISLMQWFRDYIYIPLGGSRHGNSVTIRNIFIVFLISGLWHGASWNFIIWGLYWAVVYVSAKYFFACARMKRPILFSDFPNILLTCAFSFFGFYIFRCSEIEQILAGFRALWLIFPLVALLWAGAKLIVRFPKTSIAILCIVAMATLVVILCRNYELLFKIWWLVPAAIVVAIEWQGRNSNHVIDHIPRSRWVRWSLYYVAMLLIILSEPIDMKFIYFQF